MVDLHSGLLTNDARNRYQARAATAPLWLRVRGISANELYLWGSPCFGRYLRNSYLRSHAIRLRSVSRSEEHTSELQSLMRISYAVFCMKKKTNINTINN